MANAFEFILNGCAVRVANCSPAITLLEFLRARGLTGAKEGCAEGDCGACSVAVRERAAAGEPTWRAINSCLVPVALLAGREVLTVEGVAGRDGLHPVQQAMVQAHGSQCGYCTPGIILSLFEGYHRRDLKESWQLDDQLCGNLCRCTGYRSIRDAALQALRQKPDEADTVATGSNGSFAPAPYEAGGELFFRPGSLPELLKLQRRFPESRMVAGATELGLDITKRYQKFPVLIALEGVAELREFREAKDAWRIGAAVPLTEIEDRLGAEYPALHSMLRRFGSRQIRNRATLGGNLVTASPIGDAAPFLLAFDARVALAGRGPRELALAKFFTGYRQTVLQEREVMTHILLPRGPAHPGVKRFSAFYKVSKRREMDIATVSACFVLDIDQEDFVRHARLAFGGVAPIPARARRAEQTLIGRKWSAETRARALQVLATEFTPISDVRGSAEYRRQLVTSLLGKFYHEVAEETEARTSQATAELREPNSAPDPALLPSAPAAGPHESAHLHVTGEALYADDQAAGKPMLEAWPVCSPHAHAGIVRRDATAARATPGVHAILLAEDIPGRNDVGVVRADEPLLAEREVQFHGQLVALVVGASPEACRAGAEKVVVEYEPRPAILTIEQALAGQSFHNEPNCIRRGDARQALASAPFTLEGEFSLGGQEHFYLETQSAWAEPREDGAMFVSCSTQHPSEVQAVVARVLGVAANRVVVQCPRVGGGFGGKETQAATPAALAALAAHTSGRAVRVRFNRDQDMILTGKRHPLVAKFRAGFDGTGMLQALQAEIYSNGGWSLDLSQAVTDRALFHLDNAYYLPHAEVQGRVAKTNLVSNTAFRGFGGPQGMLVIEEILDRIARRLGLPPEVVRERNLYRGTGETNTTHYGQEIDDNRLQTIWHTLKETSRFTARRVEIARWNHQHPHARRGLAITPVKFGISFTVTHLNQAGALVLIYQDGSVQVNHGGIEMGQGVHTNIQAIAAQALGVAPAQVRVMTTSTDKVPNTSATAASCGTDLNGAAVQNACEILRERLAPVAARLLAEKLGRAPPLEEQPHFADGLVRVESRPEVTIPFPEVIHHAYLERVSLSATGYHRTPDIHWDRATGRGRPFHYFACGAAVTEVEVDGFTGMLTVRRVDILHDAGHPINPGVNLGQVEGGFVQGMGWLTCEELKWDGQGRLVTHSPDTYKIPAFGDRPSEFHVNFLQDAVQPGVVHGSKAVGEPPLMLAISAREAIRDAIAAFGPAGGEVRLDSPATPEAIFMAIRRRLADPSDGSTTTASMAFSRWP